MDADEQDCEGIYGKEKLTMTRKEAAELLGISTATVTQWVLEGRLKAYRVSDRPKSTVFVYERRLRGFFEAVEVEPTKLRDKKRKVVGKVMFIKW